MLKPEPFEVHPIEVPPKNWRPLALSVVAHVALILLILFRPIPAPEAGPVEKARDAQAIAIAPTERFRQPRQSTPPPPPVPEKPIPLGPDAKRPDEPPREQSPQTPPREDASPVPDPPPETPTPQESPAPAPEQAERIPTPRDMVANGSILGPPTSPFGRSTIQPFGTPKGTASSGASRVGSMGSIGFHQNDTRVFTESFPEATGQCVEIPDLGKNPDGSPVLASVTGIVRDERGRPLANAHLQLQGLAFATFSDGAGNYRLEFDPALLQKCRSQVVRVRADGYRDQYLNLAIGRNVRSDDVIMRRR